MSELTPEIADQVLSACETNLAEIAGAFTRALDVEMTATLGESSSFTQGEADAEFDGPGLAIVVSIGDVGAMLLLPESTGLLPDWYAQPDATGKSKLTTLAQELGMLVLPDSFFSDDFQAGRVAVLKQAIGTAELTDPAGQVTLNLASDPKQGVLRILWPAHRPSSVFAPTSEAPPQVQQAAEETAKETTEKKEAKPAARPSVTGSVNRQTLPSSGEFPSYLSSLMRISVPLSVTLAKKRQSIEQILELMPGSIIPFDKSCKQQLSLEVASQVIGEGEVVKVGDKFGLRITSLVLPHERFTAVSSKQARSS